MKQRVVIINQARMASTRLPDKVMRRVLGKTLLEHQVDRLRRAKLTDDIVVATTTNDVDISIVELCNKIGVKYYRGPEEDVLARYYGAAMAFNADIVTRVTSDCPIIDSGVIDSTVSFYEKNRDSFDLVTSYSENFLGISAEVFPFSVLEDAYKNATDRSDREHVTLYMHRRPEKYRIGRISLLNDAGHYRWTVDTAEDLELVTRIYEALYPADKFFSINDVLLLMKKHPELADLNAHVRQRIYG